MNQHVQKILDFIQQSEHLSAEEKTTLLKSAKDADKEIEIVAFKLERTEKVKRTTAILLEETIEELEQKRKAVEAQNRELEIESSLERVRTQAMSMSKPDDLMDICQVVYTDLLLLGFDELRNVMINIYEDHKTYFLNYDYAPVAGKTVTQMPYNFHPLIEKQVRETKNAHDAFNEFSFTGKELKDFRELRKNNGELDDPKLEDSSSLHYYFYSIGTGSIGISTYNAISENKLNLIKRFRNVFNLAYQRYIDITKALYQTREAQIELALERVRSRSIAMHKSDELNDVVAILFEKLKDLQIPVTAASIGVYIDGSKDMHVYVCGENEDGLVISNYRFPYFNNKISNDFDNARENKFGFLSHTYTREEKNAFYEYLFEHTAIMQVPDDIRSMIFESPAYTISMAPVNHSIFAVNDFEGKVLAENEVDIIKRFSRVFDQTYTRFLDLQKAEALAREAQIETALERVRSRSMGMQKSEELKEVIKIVYKQLKHLKINLDHAGFVVDYTPGGDWHFWIADEQDIPSKITHPYFESVWATQFNESKEKDADFFTTHLNFEEKNIFYNELLSYVPGLPEASKKFYLNCPGLAASTVLFENVSLYIENFSGTPYTDEENTTLMRFGKVFQQTYTRFLDLQKAEAQALRAEQDLIEIKISRKKAEDALNELQAAQAQLIQSEKMASLGELTAGIAHEIQNPLNFVNNFSDLSAELIDEMNEEINKGNFEDAKQIAADLKQNLEKINHHGKRAGDIVKGMLQHSRSSSGVKEPTNINALADEYLRLAYHGLRAKDKSFNATMKTEFDETIGNINIIPQDIGRVILNLITNAFYVVDEKKKQQPEGYEPTVSVSTKRSLSFGEGRGEVSITVKDNGNGIPQKILDKIFQPFFTTKPTGQGTGLGLSLSYDIVKAHGGEIKVNTKENEGTTFTILLPA